MSHKPKLSRPESFSFGLLSGVLLCDKVRGVRKCIDYQPLTNHHRQARSTLTAMTFPPVVTVTCQQRLTPGIFRAQRWEIIRPDNPLGLNPGHKSSCQGSVTGVRGQNQPMIWSPHHSQDRTACGRVTKERSGYQTELPLWEEWCIQILMKPNLYHTGVFTSLQL